MLQSSMVGFLSGAVVQSDSETPPERARGLHAYVLYPSLPLE